MRPILAVSWLLLAGTVMAQTPSSALTVNSRLPDHQAKAVPPDTHLTLTFDRAPGYETLGQVRIYDAADNSLVDTIDLSASPQRYTIGGTAYNAYPVLISGNTATIYPHHPLAYNKTYYVQMDPRVVKNEAGDFAGFSGNTGWTFTTKAAPPGAEAKRLVVAADDTGDFATVQGALDFIPRNNANPVTLFIRKGLYAEIINFSNKANLTFLGEDRLDTVLGYPNNPRLNMSNRCVMQGNNAPGIALVNLTIRDTTPKMGGGNQAETIIFKGAGNLIISHCNFYSFQDTIQIDCPAYVTDCHVEGDIDFLWGTGAVFYTNCYLKELTSKDSVLVLRNAAPRHGAVLLNCKIDTAPGVTGAFLEQNQGYGDSEVVLLNCTLGPGFDPVGWRGTNTANVHNWEYNSTNISDGQPVDVSKRAAWSKQLTKESDAETIANYSNPAYLLGGWNPALAPLILNQPAAAAVSAGQSVTLSVTAAAIPVATYQWLRNGAAVSGATEATFKIDNAQAGQAGNYTVTVTNASGSATSSPAMVTVSALTR